MPTPQQVTRAQVRAALDSQLADTASGPSLSPATDGLIDAALAGVDQATITDTERGRWTLRVWDRTSPINGVPAQTVIDSRDDLPLAGDVYLLLRDGQIIYFQPHDPAEAGFVAIPVGQGAARAAVHLDRIIADAAVAEVLRQVMDRVTAGG